jgi:AbrB family looped-hinge helix DNA binding protein
MVATGIVRRVDELGRVVIPREIRRALRINDGDPLEICRDGMNLVLRKYQPDDITESAKTLKELLDEPEINEIFNLREKKSFQNLFDKILAAKEAND